MPRAACSTVSKVEISLSFDSVRMRRYARVMLLAGALAARFVSAGAQAPQPYEGRSLAEALQVLQAQGLRIIFSSAIVTPEMRVHVEPRATNTRRQLDELLAPHGLQARKGPGGTVQIVRGKPPVEKPRISAQGTIESPATGPVTDVPQMTYTEYDRSAGRRQRPGSGRGIGVGLRSN